MEQNDRTLIVKGEGMARGQSVQIKELPMNKIKLGRNSRLQASNEDLSGLMQSINSTGLLEPIGVVETKDGKGYEVAYGNRRFMAFSRLNLHSIPCVIHKRRNDNDVDVKNLAENVQRRNISMAEIGRYATLLEQEGLHIKELAVRLGTSINYVENCLKAYNDVPKEFQNDLEPSLSGTVKEPGKISIKSALAITSAAKSYSLGRQFKNALFKSAKENPDFNATRVPEYIAALKKGAKDPVKEVRPVKTVIVRLLMYEEEYDRLVKKHIDNGPFSSVTGLVQAIVEGKKSEHIKLIK